MTYRHVSRTYWAAFRWCVLSSIMFFFFFQAEDGIRDGTVTGVQTCALPISLLYTSGGVPSATVPINTGLHADFPRFIKIRSEERRVGKECRSRWSPYH